MFTRWICGLTAALVIPDHFLNDLFVNILMFLSHRFQTELGYDILEIHDGPNLLSPLIGSFNGTQVPQFLFSSSNFLYLLFITDNSRSNVGFKILYESKSEAKSLFDIVYIKSGYLSELISSAGQSKPSKCCVSKTTAAARCQLQGHSYIRWSWSLT